MPRQTFPVFYHLHSYDVRPLLQDSLGHEGRTGGDPSETGHVRSWYIVPVNSSTPLRVPPSFTPEAESRSLLDPRRRVSVSRHSTEPSSRRSNSIRKSPVVGGVVGWTSVSCLGLGLRGSVRVGG